MPQICDQHDPDAEGRLLIKVSRFMLMQPQFDDGQHKDAAYLSVLNRFNIIKSYMPVRLTVHV